MKSFKMKGLSWNRLELNNSENENENKYFIEPSVCEIITLEPEDQDNTGAAAISQEIVKFRRVDFIGKNWNNVTCKIDALSSEIDKQDPWHDIMIS